MSTPPAPTAAGRLMLRRPSSTTPSSSFLSRRGLLLRGWRLEAGGWRRRGARAPGTEDGAPSTALASGTKHPAKSTTKQPDPLPCCPALSRARGSREYREDNQRIL